MKQFAYALSSFGLATATCLALASPTPSPVAPPDARPRKGLVQIQGSGLAASSRCLAPATARWPAQSMARPSHASRLQGPGDANWSTAFQDLPEGRVTALATDGRGNVYASGFFRAAGTVAAANIARWNGTAWQPLGTGFPSIAGPFEDPIAALAVDGAGTLYAAGAFTTAGGVAARGVARWNGSTWAALGAGLRPDYIKALAVDGAGVVYVGGRFNRGSDSDSLIMRWNGTSWANVPGFAGGEVRALALDNQGNLCAGGSLTLSGIPASGLIARLTATGWQSLNPDAGSGRCCSYVETLVADAQGNLYAGGVFIRGSGYSNVLKWDGSTWTGLGTVPQYFSFNLRAARYSVLALDGQGVLYAGNNITDPGVVTTNGSVVRWTGTAWVSAGAGTGSTVRALVADGQGHLYAGGDPLTIGGGPASFVARYTTATTAWNALSTWPLSGGIGESIFALAADGRGGAFVGGDLKQAGTLAVNSVAHWDGSRWTALGAGIAGNDNVYAMAADGQGNLYVGGNLDNAGGLPVQRIARWNGSTWSALGTGMNNYVVALALGGPGVLYAAGGFTTAGGVPARYVARWDGTSWSALGAGIAGNFGVQHLVADRAGNVYAGGLFTSAGGVPAQHVARWNGTSWSALGAGLPDTLAGLAVDGAGTLYASTHRRSGSSYTTVSSVVSRWSGTAWVALGARQAGALGPLAVDGQGNLFAAHRPVQGSSSRATAVLRWTGTGWASLGTGTNHSVYDLAASGTGLYVGGYFTATGDGSVAMRNIGYYANAALGTATPASPEGGFDLFPNPARNTATLRLPAGAKRRPLLLLDALGREVRRYPAPTGTEATLDLRGLPAGVYVLRSGISSQRLVVE